MNLLLVYKTDVHHSRDSRTLVGIYTNLSKLMKDMMESGDFSEWDVNFFFGSFGGSKWQTQGDSESDRGYELIAEEYSDESINILMIEKD